MKRYLQTFALRTQFPPFVWFYAALYVLAMRLCARRLRRIKGVRAIYLRRALAFGRPLYGLSDIDMLVMIDGAEPRARAVVEYRYELLSRLFPMLGELELFTPELFQSLFQNSTFHRNRINDGRRQWRRLWGEDIFRDLPEVPESEARFLALQELNASWYFFCYEFLPSDERPGYLRRYLAYKAVAEAARAALVASGAPLQLGRDEAFQEAARRWPELAESLKRVDRWRRRLLGRDAVDPDVAGRVIHQLAHRGIEGDPPAAAARYRFRILPAPVQFVRSVLGEGATTRIESALAEVGSVERAVLIPRLNFEPEGLLDLDPHALAGATIDAFELALIGRQLPPAESLRRMNAALEPLQPFVNPFFCDGRLAMSLRPVWGWAVKHPISDPVFFACLERTAPFGEKLELSGGVELDFRSDAPQPLERRARTLLACFREPDAFQMSVRALLMLFWEAGRAAWLASQVGKPVIEVPAGSSQVADALASLTPGDEPTLREVHREYWKELRGEPSECIRYVHWLVRYAQRLQDQLFSAQPAPKLEPPGQARRVQRPNAGAGARGLKPLVWAGSLSAPSTSVSTLLPARTRLSISVVIVTRNRASLLRQALESLVQQARLADQVIVVDNASTDETPAVAREFAGRLNLTLLREESLGIPHVRNVGVAHCNGDIIAFLDDDCEADRHWLGELELPFLKDPHIGAVGGSMLPAAGQRGMIARFYDTRMAEGSATEETDQPWSSKFSRTSRKRAIWRRGAIPQ